MFARLWWKEYRVFGPVWLVLGLAAGLLQWLFRSVGSEDSRAGGLTVSALCWAVLYAFASGAATFAGERESKTLGFLDALPVGRWALWAGKASFSVISTAGLALLLAGMAALGTETRDPVEIYGYPELSRVFGTVLFEAVAWSLLWSSMSRNALLAGVMGVLSVYASALVIHNLPGMDVTTLAKNDFVPPQVMPARLLAAGVALAVSALVMAWRPSGRSAGRTRRAAPAAPTVPIRSSSTGRSLSWQARREGWTTWLLVATVGLVGSALVAITAGPSAEVFGAIPAILASLVAGVSVFGTEYASGSRRFLVHHGVGPMAIWWRKVVVWVVATGTIPGLLLVASSFLIDPLHSGKPDAFARFWSLSLCLVNAFAVGLVCGMAIPRRITAALVGVMALIVVLPIQVGLVVNHMVPTWSAFLVPLVFVAASGAWSGDWLLEREGPRPWLRLGAYLVVPIGLLFVGYAGYRAFEVSDVGPQFVEANLRGPSIPIEQDAAEAYRRLALIRPGANPLAAEYGTMGKVEEVIENGWDRREEAPGTVLADKRGLIAYWKENLPVIEQARKASTLPLGRFEDVERLAANGPGGSIKTLRRIAGLLALDARERLSRGDLPGAWDDILAQFRMANQLGTNLPTMVQMLTAAAIHHRAVGLAFAWLDGEGQSPEALARALADLKALPTLPGPATMVQVEASILERSLELPSSELADLVLPGPFPKAWSTLERLWFTRVEAAPWERERARRVCRLLIAREMPQVVLEPYQRGTIADPRVWQLASGPGMNLVRSILPNLPAAITHLDRELVGRRALDQAVAIEAWKLAHDGAYPESLDDLVTLIIDRRLPEQGGQPADRHQPRVGPGLLDRLPLDPYSGEPFGYVRSQGQPIRSLFLPDYDPLMRLDATRPGQPLLYSVGPDRKDDGGRVNFGPNGFPTGDMTFPIP